MQTILITGGAGLIGSALSELLIEKNYSVIVLTRRQRPASGGISYSTWNIKSGEIDRSAIEKADHIIHLAGANVGEKRWTAKVKKEIIDSRVDGSHLLIKALKDISNNVQTVISASGIAWYGPDQNNHVFVESDPPNADFLGEATKMWEESIEPVNQLGKRLVIMRTPLVLSKKGGLFKELTRPLKAGVAGIMGGGKQVMSWIHIDDLVRAYLTAIENDSMRGVYNVNAAEHITNKDFILRTAKAGKRPFIAVHVPQFALRLILGEMSVEVLKSTTVDNWKLRQTGFKFLYPSVEAAINELTTAR